MPKDPDILRFSNWVQQLYFPLIHLTHYLNDVY